MWEGLLSLLSVKRQVLLRYRVTVWVVSPVDAVGKVEAIDTLEGIEETVGGLVEHSLTVRAHEHHLCCHVVAYVYGVPWCFAVKRVNGSGVTTTEDVTYHRNRVRRCTSHIEANKLCLRTVRVDVYEARSLCST